MKTPAISLSSLVSLSLALWCTAQGQPPEHIQEGFRLTRLVYENTLGERASTQFYYDADGHCASGWWELADKSKHSTNTYQYNHLGLLVTAFREFSDNLSSFETYTYNARGNCTGERFCRSDRVRGSAAYHYDPQGRRVRAVFRHHKGWLDGEAVYQYDQKGRVRSATLLTDTDTTGSIAYTYDPNGNLIREVWQFAQGWAQTFVYEYVPAACRLWSLPNPLLTNTCEFRVTREEFSFNDTLSGPSTYEYAPEGFLLRKTFSRSDGLKTVTTYEYDTQRRLKHAVRRGGDGGESEYTFEYDRTGNLLLRTQMSGGVVVSCESYQYDGNGRLQKEVLQNVDGWLTGVITFTSDARGRLQSGTYRGYGAIVANVDYVYDEHSCLREVRWTFSSGTEQRYRFEYEARRRP